MLSKELEECQTKLTAITAELEKSKKAPNGKVYHSPEKYDSAPTVFFSNIHYFVYGCRIVGLAGGQAEGVRRQISSMPKGKKLMANVY